MKQLNEWLYFTKAERRGIFLLLLGITIFTISPIFFPSIIKEEDHSELIEAKYIEFKKKQSEIDSMAKIEHSKSQYKQQQSTASIPSLDKREEKQTTYSKTEKVDLSKSEIDKEKAKPLLININSATAEEFAQIKGIGEVFSNRIVKYRTGLGGFISVNQVGTTFGLEPETFNQIRGQLFISTTYKPRMLNVNSATAEQLKMHTYISEKLANQMVNYREKVHPFASDDDLKKLYLMNDELFQKLKPYLTY